MTRKPFHSSDFTGSEGPGLAKLRALRDKTVAGIRAEARRSSGQLSGLLALAEAMTEKRWEDAILLAARWSDLGEHREAILSGREAIQRPAFQRQLKRDPDKLIEAAKAALIERYQR